jgi:hypothetical protein
MRLLRLGPEILKGLILITKALIRRARKLKLNPPILIYMNSFQNSLQLSLLLSGA